MKLPRRCASALVIAAFSGNAAAAWVVVDDHDEYIAYADPASIMRDGERVRMSDLVDLKSPQPSPYGRPHASSTSISEFDCRNLRLRRIEFALHSGQMGSGELVETVVEPRWLVNCNAGNFAGHTVAVRLSLEHRAPPRRPHPE